MYALINTPERVDLHSEAIPDCRATWFEKHRFKLSLALLLVISILAVGTSQLSLTTTYASAFGSDNPRLKQYNALQAAYASSDTVLVAMAPAEGDIYQEEFLNTVFALTQRSWALPFVQRVDSITNFQHSYSSADSLEVVPLYDPEWDGGTPLLLPQMQRVVDNEITLTNYLVSKDHRTTAVLLTLDLGERERNPAVREATDAVLALTNELRTQNPGIEFHFAGKLFQDRTQSAASKADGQLQFPLLFLVVAMVLWVFFKDIHLVLAATLTAALAVIPAAGLMGWLGVDWTVEGGAALSMIVPLAVADCVHLLTNFVQYQKSQPAQVSMSASLHLNFKPILVTTLTTAAGFLSLNFVDAPPLRLIGNTVAVGVVFAFFTTVIIVPYIARLSRPTQNCMAENEAGMVTMASWISLRARTVFLIGAVVVAIMFAGLFGNSFDQRSSEYYDNSVQYRLSTDWIAERLGSAESVDFVLSSDRNVNEINYLNFLDKFIHWLRHQPEVVSASGFSDVVKRLNRVMNNDDPNFYRIPESQELASQYVWFYEQSLPFGLDLTDLVNFERDASRVRVTLAPLSNREMVSFDQRAREYLATHSPENSHAYSSSPSLMFAYQTMDNIAGLVQAWGSTLVLVSVVLCFFLGSLRLGVLSLLPNLLPALVAFGLWGYFDGEIGLLTTIALGITLGIVVDDTVHFLMKFRLAQETFSGNVAQSVRYSFVRVGMPCLITAIALTLGFSVLTTSSFNPHADMGAMSALTVAAAWLVDFMLLPALLLITPRLWQLSSNTAPGDLDESQ